MTNYIVTPMDSPVGFEIRDVNGNLIAFAIDEGTAQVFAHVPEITDALFGMIESYQYEASPENPSLVAAKQVLLKIGHRLPYDE